MKRLLISAAATALGLTAVLYSTDAMASGISTMLPRAASSSCGGCPGGCDGSCLPCLDGPGLPACAADGSCVPKRSTYGHYPTRWRRWPGDVDVDAADPSEAIDSQDPLLRPLDPPQPAVEDRQAPPSLAEVEEENRASREASSGRANGPSPTGRPAGRPAAGPMARPAAPGRPAPRPMVEPPASRPQEPEFQPLFDEPADDDSGPPAFPFDDFGMKPGAAPASAPMVAKARISVAGEPPVFDPSVWRASGAMPAEASDQAHRSAPAYYTAPLGTPYGAVRQANLPEAATR
ncbi:hypothetical protein Mal64_21960 [Pseudobythopirellula maris]|uniref:Uncharacterized protein n=1 Tax=Pseudobythopirellula maris TaxID=2527991 RepID=A0A5C5ZNG0_9BACT|nr:hypothetical protein [Pseudobythopirellula maris]TWT88708.1 hypothetical protein Mal64_21960 [Pseudobythopirellula maris]